MRRPMARVAFALLVIPLALGWLNVLDLLLHDAVGHPARLDRADGPDAVLTLVLVAVGAMAMLGPDGPLAVFLGPSSSSRLARRLLFASLVVPALVAWVRLQGEVHGLYAAGTGTSLMVLGTFVLLAVTIWQTARVAGRTEAARKAALDELDRFFDVSVDMLATDRWRRSTRAPQPSLDRDPGLPGRGHGRTSSDRVRPSRRRRADRDSMTDRLAQHGVVHGFQNRYRHQDGSYRWLEWNAAPSADGRLAYTTARDVTARRREEELHANQRDRLRQRNQGLAVRVTHDPLTGLHNRAWFDRAYGAVVTRRLRRGEGCGPTSAIMFDLDHFGLLNKQYGHQAGDAMLRKFAELMRRSLPGRRHRRSIRRRGVRRRPRRLHPRGRSARRQRRSQGPGAGGHRPRRTDPAGYGLGGLCCARAGHDAHRPAGPRRPGTLDGQARRAQHGGRGVAPGRGTRVWRPRQESNLRPTA